MNEAKEIETTSEAYSELGKVAAHSDVWLVISTNHRDHKWPCTGRGWSAATERKYLEGVQLLDILAKELRKVRNAGGRMFIARHGAYYKPYEQHFEKFATFKFV